MLVDFLQQLFNLLIALTALRYVQAVVTDKNPGSPTASALAFILH